MNDETRENDWNMHGSDMEEDLLEGIEEIAEHLPTVGDPLSVECSGNINESNVDMKFGERLAKEWIRLNKELEKQGRQGVKYQAVWMISGRQIKDTEHLVKFILKTMNRYFAQEVKLEKLDDGYIIIKHLSTRRQRSQGHIKSIILILLCV